MNKTIVMKILEQKKINYEYFEYDAGIVDGIGVASTLKEDVNQVFKTLVTTDGNNHFYVFVIPVNATLDVKKVAKIVGKKSIDMIGFLGRNKTKKCKKSDLNSVQVKLCRFE